eukprot:GHVS01005579.1.p1 GENE.GHVS01005579.1~~GHVS01005579.1.p1  ORF type:complete len:548 (-),score=84.42 GHVS01005579.1:256-1899(-)
MSVNDIILIVAIVVLMILAFLVDLKLLFYFEHTDDGTLNKQILAKVSILLGLQLGWIMIILLPVDVYNQHPPGQAAGVTGDLNMQVFWQCVWWMVALYLVVLLPFSSFYYEADDDPRISRQPPWRRALCYTIFTFVICGAIIGIIYIFLQTTTITVTKVMCDSWDLPTTDIPAAAGQGATDINKRCQDMAGSSNTTSESLEMPISFSTYLIGAMAFVGWWFFVLFGGIGLTALPLDLIVGFVDRPKPIDLSAFSDRKRFLGEKARTLKLVGESLKQQEELLITPSSSSSRWHVRKQKQLLKSDLNKFRQAVFVLDKEFTNLNISLKQRGENPFFAYLKLFLGLCCAIMTVLWIVQIILYMIIPTVSNIVVDSNTNAWMRFLDGLLEIIRESTAGMIALFLYALFVIYLLLCVMKGCFKFGMRVFCCFPIHPMRKDETHLNSFLFNVAMILVSASAVIQFSQQAFRSYASHTAATWIFEIQLHVIKFFGVFFKYNVFIYLLLLWSFITAIYLCVRPRDRMSAEMLKFKELPNHMQLQAEDRAATTAAT